MRKVVLIVKCKAKSLINELNEWYDITPPVDPTEDYMAPEEIEHQGSQF